MSDFGWGMLALITPVVCITVIIIAMIIASSIENRRDP